MLQTSKALAKVVAIALWMGLAGCHSTSSFSPPASLAGSAQTSTLRPILDCAPRGKSVPICGFKNPEDIVPLPGNQALLVSEYGDVAHARAGALVLLDPNTHALTRVFDAASRGGAPTPGWGSADCSGPPGARFSPHGIDLVRRADDALSLLVVQHGDREAIEFFEVKGSATDWTVEWRGCVAAPPDANLNEVVGFADGSFYTTKMVSMQQTDWVESMPETDTGNAFAWTPTEGYRAIPGTSGIMPNGIEASPDGRIVYMNASMGNELRKVEVATGKLLGRADVALPDNVTWSPDGKSLLVASLGASTPEDFSVCANLEAGACPLPFRIVEVDAATLSTRVLFDSAGSPMGAGTVGLRVGDDLYIGSFSGDRVLKVDLR